MAPVRGESVTSGFFNNPKATKEAFQDDWLKTGDMGIMTDGRITITGRIKDIIFLNGQNFYAHDIETTVNEMEKVQPYRISVCGWHDEKEGKEKVALFSRLRIPKENTLVFYSKIWRHVSETMSIALDYIVPVKSIPKTTSR